tara:strand:+ start:1153 stop:1407 length:255 start_codon:yes stop_codon:yes gene_type:complete
LTFSFFVGVVTSGDYSKKKYVLTTLKNQGHTAIPIEDFAAMLPKISLLRKGATSKVDSEHTFLTYSHFPGAYDDNHRRLCGNLI